MKPYKLIDEKELLLKLRDGDRAAFAELYDRYKIKITIQLFSILKIESLVEDTLQELFFRVWDKRQHIDSEKPIGNYFFRIAANNFRKKAKKETAVWQFLFQKLNSDIKNGTDWRFVL